MSEPESNPWPQLTSPVAIGCCAGLPLLVAATAGVAVYVVAGVVVAVVVAAVVALVQLRRRADAAGSRSRPDA